MLIKLDWDFGVVVERNRVDWLGDVAIWSDTVVGNESFKVVFSNKVVNGSVWLVKFGEGEDIVGIEVDSSFVV